MGCGRLSGRLETPNEQQQKDRRQCQPRNDTEAIHKRQQTHLMLKLLVEVTLRGGRGIRTRKTLGHEIIRQITDPTT